MRYWFCFIIHRDKKQCLKERKYRGITETSWAEPVNPFSPIVRRYLYVFMCEGSTCAQMAFSEQTRFLVNFKKKTWPEVNWCHDKSNRSILTSESMSISLEWVSQCGQSKIIFFSVTAALQKLFSLKLVLTPKYTHSKRIFLDHMLKKFLKVTNLQLYQSRSQKITTYILTKNEIFEPK